MFGKELNYSGVAWPKAKVIKSGRAELKFQPGGQFVPWQELPAEPIQPTPPFLWFQISAAGYEKPWQTNRPQAFWRTLSEFNPGTDPSYGEHAADFVRRFGPVFEPYEPGVTSTGDWDTAICFLRRAAEAWDDPEGADGISRVTANRARRDKVRRIIHLLLPAAMDRVEV